VVRDGRGGLRAEELRAVVGVADDERVVRVLGPRIARDPVDPEEAAVLEEDVTGAVREGNGYQERRDA